MDLSHYKPCISCELLLSNLTSRPCDEDIEEGLHGDDGGNSLVEYFFDGVHDILLSRGPKNEKA
jgi:hypothetical protein